MTITKMIFRKGDKRIQAFTLSSPTISATVIDYGATLTHFTLHKDKDKDIDVLLGYDDPFEYLENSKNPYFGAIIGRSANRTAKGMFTLNGRQYQLPINNGPNSLHGGSKGFDKQYWTVKSSDSMPLLELELLSEHMEQGYPGTVRVSVIYSILENQLKIETSVTLIDDIAKEAYVNLTAHPYFNLSGGKYQTITDHVVDMSGVKGVLEVDDTQIPTGKILTVQSNPELIFDSPSVLSEKLNHVQQFNGFDHFYLADSTPFITISCPTTGITLSVSSDCAGFQFYTGNWIEEQSSKSIHQCKKYGQYSGFCIEPSPPPNSINLPQFRDSVIVTQEKPWNHWITYTLSTF